MAQSGLERDLRKRELAGLPARDSFSLLIGEAAACRKCQGMCGRRAVLSEYMKKYFRAVSRLTALAREGQNHEPS